MNNKTNQIICTYFTNGKMHDFRIFKKSRIPLRNTQTILFDTGYTGILNIYKNNLNILIPKKKSKNNPLTKEDRERNKKISRIRINVENITGDIKDI